MAWFTLAHRLGQPLQKLQRETTSREFLEWIEYFKRDTNEFHREDYYWAQLTAEVCRSWVDKPSKVKVSHFLIRFGKEDKLEVVPLTPEQKKAHIKKSKDAWATIPGIVFKRKVIKKE